MGATKIVKNSSVSTFAISEEIFHEESLVLLKKISRAYIGMTFCQRSRSILPNITNKSFLRHRAIFLKDGDTCHLMQTLSRRPCARGKTLQENLVHLL